MNHVVTLESKKEASLKSAETPCLILDVDRMDRNIRRLNARLKTLGPTLRPHLKTVKSVEVARRVMMDDAGSATVSTLKEAEQFGSAGVRDIICAVGIASGKYRSASRSADRHPRAYSAQSCLCDGCPTSTLLCRSWKFRCHRGLLAAIRRLVMSGTLGNAIYAAAFGDARPARSVVPIPELHHGYLVEIDAIAVIDPH